MWTPPVFLYRAGRQQVNSRSYWNDAEMTEDGPRRLLIKQTLAGEGVVYAGGVRSPVPEGSVFVIERPGPYRYGYEGEGTPWSFEYVSIAFAGSEPLLPPALAAAPVWDFRRNPHLRRELSSLVDVCEAGEGAGLRASSLGYRFYLALIEARQAGAERHRGAIRLRELLEREFRNPKASLADLSREVGLSQAALSRIFSREYGLSPARALMQLRLAEARRRLEAGELSLKEIAHASGFSGVNYFCRVFRLAYARTPAAYRANPDPLMALSFNGSCR